jgi:glutamate/tyrosine decarboxylase-like PLP-dependent enzyme
MKWKRLSRKTINTNIEAALERNINFYDDPAMGVPASHLDREEFAASNQILEGSTYLKTLINNPNHIGVHTDGKESESFFAGTQKLEADVIEVIGEDILRAHEQCIDGYISSGGTEGNIQALWIYRNYYREKYELSKDYSNIAVICSSDSHYSFDKGADLLNLNILKVEVDEDTRRLKPEAIKEVAGQLKEMGCDKLILICNMMTTMYGSVDNLDDYWPALSNIATEIKVHVDGAYGGFLYPFTVTDQKLNFKDDRINSFTLDAHKMLQAPYGTGIFICRKGMMDFTLTSSAQYVSGMDCTLVGSRSGANAISVYKILFNYGPFDWKEKVDQLVYRTQILAAHLKKLDLKHICFQGSNIVTIHSSGLEKSIIKKYGLVPDNHHDPTWFKIVVMDHVKGDKIQAFLQELYDHHGKEFNPMVFPSN